MPTLLFGILLFQAPNTLGVDVFSASVRGSLLILIFIGTFAVPSLLIYYLFRSGYVQSLYLNTLADRRLPYFLTAIVYTVVTAFFGFRMETISQLAPEIAILLGSVTVSILLVGIISLYWQISAHGVGIGGVVGAIAGMVAQSGTVELVPSLAIVIALAGLVLSARLHLNAHTTAQTTAGLLLGLLVSLTAVLWLV
ncbi:hypothetical protein HH216_12615 [Spirosoma rhododendri]|uniref:PAP2 superfamily protein n=2 Tax=Spirosoma rhododendri TaxID=2728024 RepID=A0A7L5DS73_9BACT|nr:hypothetical protein [Spirosoma rhododendri]QJD81354.1 hypothetical protein HH216_12615 [Spirosoma rhododendri]